MIQHIRGTGLLAGREEQLMDMLLHKYEGGQTNEEARLQRVRAWHACAGGGWLIRVLAGSAPAAATLRM